MEWNYYFTHFHNVLGDKNIHHCVLMESNFVIFTGHSTFWQELCIIDFKKVNVIYIRLNREQEPRSFELLVQTIHQFECYNNFIAITAESNIFLNFKDGIFEYETEYLVQLEKIVFGVIKNTTLNKILIISDLAGYIQAESR